MASVTTERSKRHQTTAPSVEASLSQPGSTIEDCARALAQLDAQIKALEKDKQGAREGYLTHARQEKARGTLARKTVTLPLHFFKRVNIDEKDFWRTRYPAWTVVNLRVNTEDKVLEYIIEHNPEYLAHSLEVKCADGKTRKVGKQVQHIKPEIDTETLRLDDPEVFERITRPKIVYEIDGEALDRAIKETPEIMALISRHFIVPTPRIKLAPIKELEDE